MCQLKKFVQKDSPVHFRCLLLLALALAHFNQAFPYPLSRSAKGNAEFEDMTDVCCDCCVMAHLCRTVGIMVFFMYLMSMMVVGSGNTNKLMALMSLRALFLIVWTCYVQMSVPKDPSTLNRIANMVTMKIVHVATVWDFVADVLQSAAGNEQVQGAGMYGVALIVSFVLHMAEYCQSEHTLKVTVGVEEPVAEDEAAQAKDEAEEAAQAATSELEQGQEMSAEMSVSAVDDDGRQGTLAIKATVGAGNSLLASVVMVTINMMLHVGLRIEKLRMAAKELRRGLENGAVGHTVSTQVKVADS